MAEEEPEYGMADRRCPLHSLAALCYNHNRFKQSAISCASIAQLVEQLTLNQRVVGSSPTGGSLRIWRIP
jgi:hypothetical protein